MEVEETLIGSIGKGKKKKLRSANCKIRIDVVKIYRETICRIYFKS